MKSIFCAGLVALMVAWLTFLPGCASEQSNSAVTADSSASPGSENPAPPPRLYTSYNLWGKTPDRMYCVNYCGVGQMLPAGTEVSRAWIAGGNIKFITAKDGVTYTMSYRSKLYPSQTIETFKDRLFTPKTLEELTQGLTEQEISCIKNGTLVPGLSKRAVLIARGYPPGHQTPSVDSNTWFYWQSRFDKIAVYFDDTGHLKQVGD